MNNHMSKREAKAMFIENGGIVKDDKTATRCGWNDFTDALHKAKRITSKQYNDWENPFK